MLTLSRLFPTILYIIATTLTLFSVANIMYIEFLNESFNHSLNSLSKIVDSTKTEQKRVYIYVDTLSWRTTPTVELECEVKFIKKLKLKIGQKTLENFPKIVYKASLGYYDDSKYDPFSNTVIIASGERTDRYAMFVLKHELGHWIDMKLSPNHFSKDFQGNSQHVATFLGYELEKFLNGFPSELDSVLTR